KEQLPHPMKRRRAIGRTTLARMADDESGELRPTRPNAHVVNQAAMMADKYYGRMRQPIIRPGIPPSQLYIPPRPDDAEDFEIREEALASGYLSQALDALNDAGDPRRLYPPEAFLPERTIAHEALARYLASTRVVDASRTSVLFSALACEAYANRF